MGFGFRYWKNLMKGVWRNSNALHIIIPVLVWTVGVCGYRGYTVTNAIIGAVLGLLFMALFVIVGTLLITFRKKKLLSVLDEYGFSPEYLRAYEREKITNKPFILQNAVQYAEIFMNMGQPADAIKYLNTLTVPENAALADKVGYFFVYVMSALKIGNIAIAEDMWERSMPMIQTAQKQQGYTAYSRLLYISLINIDLYAARATGSAERLQRAYEQTVSYMNSRIYKKYPIEDCDFDIILLYELRAMGRMDEYNALLPKVRAKVENYEPLFLATKKDAAQNLDRVLNGEIPI